MRSMQISEKFALEQMEPEWRRRGYTVIREPKPDELPPFLRSYGPSTIAIGRMPSLVIEVMRRRNKSTEYRLRNLQDLLAGRDDWRLETIYLSSEGTPIDPASSADIVKTLAAMRGLQAVDGRAALVLGWAALEASARALEPDLASGILSVGSLIDVLVSMGHATQADGVFLREIGAMRDKVAHGQLNLLPDPEGLARLADLIDRLNGPSDMAA